jgi:hypothetical protein
MIGITSGLRFNFESSCPCQRCALRRMTQPLSRLSKPCLVEQRLDKTRHATPRIRVIL